MCCSYCFGGCFGDGWRRRGGIFSEPLAEEGEGEPVYVCVCGGDAVASRGCEREAEEFGFGGEFAVVEVVDFVFDYVDDVGGDGVAELVGARGPLAYDVYERFGEDYFGAGEVAEFEVAGGVFGDLFPEPALELEEVVVDSRTDYF